MAKKTKIKLVPINCRHSEILNIKKLKPNPKNPNTHPKEQIELFCKILEYQGIREPVRISNRNGRMTKGHGLLLACKELGITEIPVEYQDYDSFDQEYADMVADNELARWSSTDFALVNAEIPNLGPMDIDLLAIRNFEVEPADKINYQEEWQGMPEYESKDKRGVKSIIVHFKKKADIKKFSELVNQPITDSTKYIWYPHKAKNNFKDKRYKTDES